MNLITNFNDKSVDPFKVLVDQLNRIESMVLEIKRKTEQEAKKALTEDDDDGISLAIRITGLKKKSIYNLVNKRKIPHSKKGNRLYFDKGELEDWKRSGKRAVIPEVSSSFGRK